MATIPWLPEALKDRERRRPRLRFWAPLREGFHQAPPHLRLAFYVALAWGFARPLLAFVSGTMGERSIADAYVIGTLVGIALSMGFYSVLFALVFARIRFVHLVLRAVPAIQGLNLLSLLLGEVLAPRPAFFPSNYPEFVTPPPLPHWGFFLIGVVVNGVLFALLLRRDVRDFAGKVALPDPPMDPWTRAQPVSPVDNVDALQQFPLATNAPSHWPGIRYEGAPLSSSLPEGMARSMMEAAVAATLAAGGREDAPKLRKLLPRRLFDAGVLEASMEVEDEGRARLVFVYPRADSQAASHFRGVKTFLENAGEPTPVYYSPAALPASTELVDPLTPFGPDSLRTSRGEALPAGEYACVWASAEEPSVTHAGAFVAMGRAIAALNGRERKAFSALLTALGSSDQASSLPTLDGNLSIALEGPDAIPIILTASLEKGIRFHFPKAVAAKSVEQFWQRFAEDALKLRAREEHAPAIAAEGPPLTPHAWWEFASKAISKSEERGIRLGAFGVVLNPGEGAWATADALSPEGGPLEVYEFVPKSTSDRFQSVLRQRMESQVKATVSRDPAHPQPKLSWVFEDPSSIR